MRFSTKVLKERRTYFFDARDKSRRLLPTITESKKNSGENGEGLFRKSHKIYL